MSVYLQVQEWKGSADGLIPTEWGWQMCDEGFVPLQTALAPAPDNLLRVFRCSCLTDCAPCDARARSTALNALRHVETVGDQAAQIHYKWHVTMTDTMMMHKCKSLDCLKVLPRFTRTVSATFSYFMMTLIMICRIVSCFTRTLDLYVCVVFVPFYDFTI